MTSLTSASSAVVGITAGRLVAAPLPFVPSSFSQGTPPSLRPDLSEQILIKLPMSCIDVIACQSHSTDANLKGRL
ncbi:hypothetical protein CHARACLAT_022286 [Characodon lateralis]|uniref:Secreted protein n=1 Tax=Characodon lateralis TaxID=208331 RepID=A0ABU7ELB0_9TELE|nr:hypothetical protein [Characodon lateralis]